MVMMESNYKEPKIKVLVIDDDVDERRRILNFLAGDHDVEICTFFSSGFDVVSGIKFHKPDVVVTDFLATDADKTLVVEKINSSGMKNKPRIIVMSSVNNIKIPEKVFSYGTDYYIRKPIIFSLLKDAIILVSKGRKSYQINEFVKMAKIRGVVRSVGVPVNILGYTYIVEAVKYMLDSKKAAFLSEAYKSISKSHNTSVECVEVSIRNAIKKAVCTHNENFKKVFQFCNVTPSNSAFISNLKETIFADLHMNDN